MSSPDNQLITLVMTAEDYERLLAVFEMAKALVISEHGNVEVVTGLLDRLQHANHQQA